MGDVEIRPLCIGTATRSLAVLVMGEKPELTEIAFVMFYIRAGDRHIVVDTGVPAAEDALEHHHPMRRDPGQDVGATLRRAGIEIENVDTVINTHLHWDHCSNNYLFPRATIYAQRRELQYAIAPLPLHRHAYDEVEVDGGRCVRLPPYLLSRLTLIDGDLEICPNVRLIRTPGHTPGSQSVVVTGEQRYLLAGDNVPMSQSLPALDINKLAPNSIHVNLEDYYRSMQRCIYEVDRVLPSHDQRVLDRDVYR
jgi:N-acyl homoserine lactone hydrolase